MPTGDGARRAARAAALALVLATTATLAACAPDGAAPDPAAGPADPDDPGAPTPGPLEAYLGYAVGARTQGEVAAELAAHEEAIAACMAAQGFEYTPPVIVPGTFETSDEPPRGSRGFAERYGYGIWQGPEVEPGQYTYQLDDSANAEYRASLTPEAQQAYDRALLGTPTDLPDGGTSFDGLGCREAAAVRQSPQAEYLRGVQEEVSDLLESLWLGEDPRLAEVDADWAACMRDAGYDDRSPREAEQRIIDEVTAAYGSGTGPAASVVAERAAAEHRLAIADQDCRDATGWARRRRAVEHELQQEYLAAHRADLDALVAALDAGPGA